MAGDSHVLPGDVLTSVVVGSIGNIDFHEISTFHSFVFNGSQEQPWMGVVTPGKNSIAEGREKVKGILKDMKG